jgi:hypothetical protein
MYITMYIVLFQNGLLLPTMVVEEFTSAERSGLQFSTTK